MRLSASGLDAPGMRTSSRSGTVMMRRALRNQSQAIARSRERPILAVSSGGGHWVELLRLRPAWERKKVVYAGVSPDGGNEVRPAPYYVLPDGNLHTKLALIRVFLEAFRLVMRVRPAAVISTGAAPGFVVVVVAKLFGAKTIWIDSIANAEALSISGRAVRPFADVWLTQWEHLSSEAGPQYHGSVV
ncbi:MAG: UDP-N-acetylglucosamine--LPS N-acetylglucosamine transferase [Spirochaetaceae bacterium]|nr:MAG: UDP-N-acetylglucosamine--LPS N-acetylglucosamine transferase [Spirochaetaceae bacterium]